MDGARKIVLSLLTSNCFTACAFFKEAEYPSSCRDTAERDLIEALEAISQYKSVKLANRARGYLADLRVGDNLSNHSVFLYLYLTWKIEFVETRVLFEVYRIILGWLGEGGSRGKLAFCY